MRKINPSSVFQKIVLAGAILFFLVLSACAATGGRVFHSFAFDAQRDSPDVEVLGYKIWGSAGTIDRSRDVAIDGPGRVSQYSAIGGVLPRPEYLYFKWRIKSSGEIFEVTVDLKERLPSNISGSRIFIWIDSTRLNIFLITQKLRPADWPVYKVLERNPHQAYLIYPGISHFQK